MKKSDDDDADMNDGGDNKKLKGAKGSSNGGAQQQAQQQQQSESESSSFLQILRLALGWWCFWIVVIGVLYQVCPGEPDDWFHRVPTPPAPPATGE